MTARIDHLVVVAASLEQGAAWCRETLGVEPGPGGEHPLMGTHNRLLRIATVDYPRAYFEIIAIQPGREPQDGRRRWFDMDDARLQRAVKEEPRLAHFVTVVPEIAPALRAWAELGIDRGRALKASRMTPRGLLEWQIAVRDDGQRLFDGALPTLIEWGATHPVPGMPESGVTLQSFGVAHPEHRKLATAFDAIGLAGVHVKEGAPKLCAVFDTPKGRVKLESNLLPEGA
ncbi:VOC family protein [Ramlibacter albus]|uniref:VOC family protein n=1 Tax=Ramlibacter albus TaxID=2079448 RepID=A0A923S224_9BURK|nr:VOC family protein [Ramlibacter albus]MBC5765034.1 VOC family protein [Ramlibacter albus]